LLQGCSSWEWYFPYHYAPFASDFINIGDIKNEFPSGTRPFKPLEQLMSVFPAASRQHVPDPWGELMIGNADIVSSQCSLIKFSQEITKPKTPKVHVIYFCGSDLKIFFKNSLRSSFKTDTIILSLAFILTTVCTYAPL
jgi:hypothetical protein